MTNIGSLFYNFTVSFYILEITNNNAALQGTYLLTVDKDNPGKVMSLIGVAVQGFIPLASLISGVILNRYGIAWLFAFCEKLAIEMWNYKIEQWLNWDKFIQVACFLIAFDMELTMEGIFTFLENSIGHYSPNIIQAFRAIGDNNEVDILEKICGNCFSNIIQLKFAVIQRRMEWKKDMEKF